MRGLLIGLGVSAVMLAGCGSAAAPPAPTVDPVAASDTTAQKTLDTFTGSGINTTPNFTVPSEWVVNWTDDCSKLAAISGGQPLNFQIYESNADGTVAGVLANELGKGGSGTNNQHVDGGSKHLTISSACAWTVHVVG